MAFRGRVVRVRVRVRVVRVRVVRVRVVRLRVVRLRVVNNSSSSGASDDQLHAVSVVRYPMYR